MYKLYNHHDNLTSWFSGGKRYLCIKPTSSLLKDPIKCHEGETIGKSTLEKKVD